MSRTWLAPRPPAGGATASFRWHSRSRGATDAGFTITEAVVALGLTLMVAGSFGLMFRQARLTLELQPELATLRQDGRAILDRIAADLARAGGGLPAEIPVFTDLGPAGDRNPDGLDFLTAPERLAEASFEPVVAFDGVEVRLAHPASRLDRGSGEAGRRYVVVFNDDEMTPRWAFGEVVSVRAAGNQFLEGAPGEENRGGAAVRIAPRENPWHWHFRPSVDADTFEPGSGGGLLERALQSVLGGAIEATVPGIRWWGAREPDRAGGRCDAGAIGAGTGGAAGNAGGGPAGAGNRTVRARAARAGAGYPYPLLGAECGAGCR